MASNSVASPVVTLGLDSGGIKSGVNEALGVMKGAASAIAAISEQIKSKPIELGVNSQQMLADLSGITDSVESALKAFDRLGKMGEKSFKGITASVREASQASMDMMSKLSGTYETTSAMARSGGVLKKGGADPFSAGMSKWVEANKPALDAAKWIKDSVQKPSSQASMDMMSKLSGTYDPLAALTRSTVAGPRGGPDPFLSGMKRWQETQVKAAVQKPAVVLAGPDYKSSSIGFQPWVKGFARSSAQSLINPMDYLSKSTVPLNQTLELYGKINRLIGAPIRLGMQAETSSNQSLFEGGRSALQSQSVTGSVMRFQESITRMFDDILKGIDSSFDLQGWLESARGFGDGVAAVFRGVADLMPGNKVEAGVAYDAGRNVAVDMAQETVNYLADIYNTLVDIYNGFLEWWDSNGSNLTESQLAEVAAKQKELGSTQRVGYGPFERDVFFEATFAEARKALLKEGELGGLQKIDKGAIKDFFDQVRLNEIQAKQAAEELEGGWAAIDVNKKAQFDATKSLEDFTRGLRGTLDPLASLSDSFEANAKKIQDMENAGAGAQAIMAANLANQANFAQGLADLAKGKAEQYQKSFSPGAALDASSVALAEAVIKASNNGQAAMGGIEGQQLRALEQIRAESIRNREINQRLLEAFQKNPPAPPVWVAPIAGGA